MTNEPHFAAVPSSPAARNAPLPVPPSSPPTDSVLQVQLVIAVVLTTGLLYVLLPILQMLLMAAGSGSVFAAGLLTFLVAPTLVTVGVCAHRGAGSIRTWYRAAVVASLTAATAAVLCIWALSQMEF
jgi:hypothetical protein